MPDDTLARGGHGGAPINHQQNVNGSRRQPSTVFRVGRSRRVRALARNGRNRTNPRGNTMATAQAMAGGANVQPVAIPPAGPVNPAAGPVNPLVVVLAGNVAIANAGAPPAPAPAFQGFNIDAAFLDPPLRKSQVGPFFHIR